MLSPPFFSRSRTLSVSRTKLSEATRAEEATAATTGEVEAEVRGDAEAPSAAPEAAQAHARGAASSTSGSQYVVHRSSVLLITMHLLFSFFLESISLSLSLFVSLPLFLSACLSVMIFHATQDSPSPTEEG